MDTSSQLEVPTSILCPTCIPVAIDIAPCSHSSLFSSNSEDYSKFLESINIFVEKCSWNQLMQIAKVINKEVLGRGEGVTHPMLGYFYNLYILKYYKLKIVN